MKNKHIKRIWIFNHHASGNGDRHDALAKQLAKMGIEVLIIASSYNHSEHRYIYNEQCFIENRNEGIFYVWLHTSPTYNYNGIKRIFNMISYMILIMKYSMEWCKKIGNPDIVIGSSVHPLAWEAAYWVSKKTGADFYAEVRDLWPLSLIELQGTSPKHLLVAFFSILEKRAYSRAKKIITTMPYAYKYISDSLGYSKDKIQWIPNGIDITKADNALTNPNNKLPSELDKYLEENWCAVYTGSFVESECLDYIIETAEFLQKKCNDKIKFAIVGSGHLKEMLINEINNKNLKNIKLFNRISKDQVAKVVNKSKVCLAVVRNLPIYKYGLSMNKLSDYLYSGNPTVFVCDVDNVVKISGGGITVPFGNIKLFADAIESVYEMSEYEKKNMGNKGKTTIIQSYDTKVLAEKLISILKTN